ncbi:MAG: DUF2203 family protein [Planctomycetes bacterium]|nr:DUF2203 family protein [Planctomycetota bacterium]
MKRTYTLAEANLALPLIRAIAAELVERRIDRRALRRRRELLEKAQTPEGLRGELAELDARIWEHDDAIRHCRAEFEELGMTVLRTDPLTIHIPGQNRLGPRSTTTNGTVVFCWQEGEDSVCHGHPVGEEEDQRRPLRVRAKGA